MIRVSVQRKPFALRNALRNAVCPGIGDSGDDPDPEPIIGNADWTGCCIADADERIFGFVEPSSRNIVDGGLCNPVASIQDPFLVPEHRRQGSGKPVVGRPLARHRTHALSELATDTERTNETAQAVRRASGFREFDRIVKFRMRAD